ncbi:MAG: HD domain-containing protein [Nitrospirota bacterium]|nr:HD domain-containing protein [Nitrospirota bacterium]
MIGDPSLLGAPYDGSALIADPIHEYITFTVPYSTPDPSERTEKDLIDSPWVQRLRYIYQLQSARWVYPSAEHSRFQHSLGVMHVAGRFARHLYPSLATVVPDLPSINFIEELLRVTALLHDLGHGPFCHFFDANFLEQFGLTHEHIGQVLIRERLGKIIRKIRRSPHGPFNPGEHLDPDHLAFLILKDPEKDSTRVPKWLAFLQPVIGGIYTADNLDYVLRDSYMCGVAVGPVDLTRLIHYTLITPKGLTIHRTGLPALQMFLNTRLYLYSNVYYHRTTRAIDIHLREIFGDTMKYLFPYNPLDRLDAYLYLTDWSLMETVRHWPGERSKAKRALGREWARILGRDVKWKMAYNAFLPTRGDERGRTFIDRRTVEHRLRQALPPHLRKLDFRVDMANQDPRPLNLLNMGEFQIYVYDPATRSISKEALKEFFDYLPARIVQFRIFAKDHSTDAELARAAEKVLTSDGHSVKTNV